MKRWVGTILGLYGLFAVAGSWPLRAGPPNDSIARLPDRPGLIRLLRISPRILSGAEPKSEAAFAEIRKLGVEIIVSVDASRPQIELARRHGLRYVHIPIGYDRIERDAAESLQRVIEEATGRVYFHCHHGRQRGPAAAAIAHVAAGAPAGKAALRVLRAAGTSRRYAGLWRDVEAFRPTPSAGGSADWPKLVEEATIDSLPAAMARADRALEELETLRAASWSAPADHPELNPELSIRVLSETLDELRKQTDSHDKLIAEKMSRASRSISRLSAALKASDKQLATNRLAAVKASCVDCHEQYRNR
ncbi:MAG: hypothetical protein QGG36_06890 [Pirellulaceae bacterium]|jgi:protein tyrosine phosphatase (PTP) superfamily phosphohydrolase (DUF442 family)|nr:hypothetical protein [Pirellulaceae bacterium]